jgi:hypothetical protein
MQLAKFGTLTGSDFLKGLIVSVLTTATAALYSILQTNALPTIAQLKQIGIVAFFAGISYLIKNMSTNSQDQVFKAEPTTNKVATETEIIKPVFVPVTSTATTESVPAPQPPATGVIPAALIALFAGLFFFTQPTQAGICNHLFSPVPTDTTIKTKGITLDTYALVNVGRVGLLKTDILFSGISLHYNYSGDKKTLEMGILDFTGYGLSYHWNIQYKGKNRAAMSVGVYAVTFPNKDLSKSDAGVALVLNPFGFSALTTGNVFVDKYLEGSGFGVVYNGGTGHFAAAYTLKYTFWENK